MPLTPAFVPSVVSGAPSVELPSERDDRAAVPRGLLAGFVVAAFLGLLTANGLLTAASILVLGLLVLLLWRPGEPPVLLFATGYQWVQVTAKVLHADVLGLPISEMSESSSIEMATWLSLAGLLVLAFGMWAVVRRIAPQGERLAELSTDLSPSRAFWLWVPATLLTAALANVIWSLGGFMQFARVLMVLKWGFYFMLAYLVSVRKEGYLFLAIAFVVEFVQGIGFFSGFKDVIFVTLLAVLAARVHLSGRTVGFGLALVLALFVMGSTWTVVKPAFRGQTEDNSEQVLTGNKSDQLTTLTRLIGNLQPQDLVLGLDPMIRRLAYTDFFAYTMDFVPRYRDYGRGEIWGTTLRHVAMPRLFFPDKPVLPSDSELTMAWTGRYMASDNEGTSISIGYMGESYADFGPLGMFGPILLLGLAWGGAYAAFMRRSRTPLVSLALLTVILMNAYQFEMASIKLVGGVLMQFMVLILFSRYFGSRVDEWLRESKGTAEDVAGVDYVALAGSR